MHVYHGEMICRHQLIQMLVVLVDPNFNGPVLVDVGIL